MRRLDLLSKGWLYLIHWPGMRIVKDRRLTLNNRKQGLTLLFFFLAHSHAVGRAELLPTAAHFKVRVYRVYFFFKVKCGFYC